MGNEYHEGSGDRTGVCVNALLSARMRCVAPSWSVGATVRPARRSFSAIICYMVFDMHSLITTFTQ
jgi:hypothetical protein